MKVRATLLGGNDMRGAQGGMAVENPIRIGVVGLGHRALHMVRQANRYIDYAPVAVCDIRPELVERAKADLKDELGLDLRGYTDFDSMLAEEELDAVAVHVDADKQPALVCQALDAGCHVMCEVPLAYDMDSCRDIVQAVERNDRVFLLMEQTRFWGFVRAWQKIVQAGVIGHPLYVEGEYLGYYPSLFFQDDGGQFYVPDEAERNPAAKPTWRQERHTIHYLPHELSPLLYILGDRVKRVTAMSTRNQSYHMPNVQLADVQVALMHTEKDTIMKLATGFTSPVIHRGETHHHWYHIKGSEGALEWTRAEWDKPKLWVHGWQMPEPVPMPWGLARLDAPVGAQGSGHGDADFYVYAQFADAVLRGVPPELDVYGAVDTAAPAILAAKSIDEDNMPQDVPDFRSAQAAE
ncbi:MAG: Gfo/Idh/MocA family oxidoreductase [bacterium]|nr:Gfo/Idh/MocA family oxidoreductase [bacterium]